MDAWVTESLASSYIAAVDGATVHSGVLCEAFSSPWYDDGVVFDWTVLHQRLVRPPSSQPYITDFTAALADFGARGAANAVKECFATVVELKAPWTLHPLSDQAQALSVFEIPAAVAASAPSTSPSTTSRHFYKFLRGPPGQRAVRDDMARVLASVQAQLRQNGITVFTFLSSVVILGEDFTELLQLTAVVFRALKEVGFTIDGHGSALGPRAVQRLRVNGADTWTTLPLQKLTAEDDVAAFVVALFFQWLQDAYIWNCTAPLHLFPDAGAASSREEATAAKGVRLFEKFVRGLVLPSVHAIGLEALTSALPEEGGSLLELAAPRLKKKAAPVGPQRWSVLELRLVLSQIGAYKSLPAEYLGTTA